MTAVEAACVRRVHLLALRAMEDAAGVAHVTPAVAAASKSTARSVAAASKSTARSVVAASKSTARSVVAASKSTARQGTSAAVSTAAAGPPGLTPGELDKLSWASPALLAAMSRALARLELVNDGKMGGFAVGVKSAGRRWLGRGRAWGGRGGGSERGHFHQVAGCLSIAGRVPVDRGSIARRLRVPDQ